MRTPQVKKPNAGGSHQKRQLSILAVLAVVLVAVVALQFGQSSAPVALASTGGEGAAGSAVALKTAGAAGDVGNPLELTDNLALSGSADSGAGLNPGAFDSFWSFNEPVDTGVDELPAPTIVLSATLIGREGELDVAVIDGNLHYVGDMLQGWSLDSISSRAVTLRSSSNRVVEVAMPLFRPTPPPEAPVAGP